MKKSANTGHFKTVERRFSDETIQALAQLGAVFNSIRKRLMDEGYTISNGKIYKYDRNIEQ
jgi:hypothetical protein